MNGYEAYGRATEVTNEASDLEGTVEGFGGEAYGWEHDATRARVRKQAQEIHDQACLVLQALAPFLADEAPKDDGTVRANPDGDERVVALCKEVGWAVVIYDAANWAGRTSRKPQSGLKVLKDLVQSAQPIDVTDDSQKDGGT